MCVIYAPKHSNHIAMHRSTIFMPTEVIGQGTEILVLLVAYLFGGTCRFMHMSMTSCMLINSPWNYLYTFFKTNRKILK